MTCEEWLDRYDAILKNLILERNRGENTFSQFEIFQRARALTLYYAGKQPAGCGAAGNVAAVVKGAKTVMGIFQWLDGKKTIIGAALDIVASVIQAALPLLPAVLAAFGVEAAAVLQVVAVLGKVLAAIGLIHKYLKYRRNGNGGN